MPRAPEFPGFVRNVSNLLLCGVQVELDEVFNRLVAGGHAIEYGPVTEPWGVRRFYVRDPFGRLVNILAHVPAISATTGG